MHLHSSPFQNMLGKGHFVGYELEMDKGGEFVVEVLRDVEDIV